MIRNEHKVFGFNFFSRKKSNKCLLELEIIKMKEKKKLVLLYSLSDFDG